MKTFLLAWLQFIEDQRVLVLFLITAGVAYLGYTAWNTEIQAFPDFTNVQIQVITQFPGKAPEEVERQVTIPVEIGMSGLPYLMNQRSVSLFGLSVVTLTFTDDAQTQKARLSVNQRLSDLDLPEGLKPELSADTTPIGEIFRYVVEGDLAADEERLIQDWTVVRALRTIPGVADIVSFGGPRRAVEIKLDLERLKLHNLSISQVAEEISKNHLNSGGRLIPRGEEAFLVRSLGMFHTPQELESAVIATSKGIPVRIKDVGKVRIGSHARLGQVGFEDQDDVVEGVVLLRQGYDAKATCQQIGDRISKLNEQLKSQGVQIRPVYDRTELINRSLHTVAHNIIFGIVLVCLILLVGFGRSFLGFTIAVALIIPFALLIAIYGVGYFKLSPNLISLGAIDFGIIIETAIFASEGLIAALLTGRLNPKNKEQVAELLTTILKPAFLCSLVLVVAFIPIVSLGRVEGKIFRPLGITLISALIGGQLGALFFIPFSVSFLRENVTQSRKKESWFERTSHQFLHQCVRRISAIPKVKFPRLTLAAILVGVILLLTIGLGREFLPTLNEGSLYVRVTAPPSISQNTAEDLADQLRTEVRKLPEVRSVISQMGRPDDGTDINGFDTLEFLIRLSDPEKWTSAHTLDELIQVLYQKLSKFKGIQVNVSQPVKDQVDEAISGVKGDLVLKIFGPKIPDLVNLAEELNSVIRSVPGAFDVSSELLKGQPELRFNINREAMARYGLKAKDVEELLELALLGKPAGKLMDSAGRPIEILIKPDFQDQEPNQRQLESLPIITSEGAKIPLGALTETEIAEGLSKIYREEGQRRIALKVNVQDRPIVEFVEAADTAVQAALTKYPQYRAEWSGSFENAKRASNQLSMTVPLVLLTILIIFYSWFKSLALLSLICFEIPFALVGSLLFLRLFHLNLSISASCGIIVAIGISFLTGTMYLEGFKSERNALGALEKRGAGILLSSLVAVIGLIPAALSQSMGSETAKPFAVAILGGLVVSTLLSMTILPYLGLSLKRIQP